MHCRRSAWVCASASRRCHLEPQCYSFRMPLDLLQQVLEQSENSAAPVKGAALLYIACVLTQFDREQLARGRIASERVRCVAARRP